MPRILLTLLIGLSLTACHGARERVAASLPFVGDESRDDLVTLAELAAEPGVYAGRQVAIPGALTVDGNTACLEDSGLAIAIRLTPEQASLYSETKQQSVIASGVFDQKICPTGALCPTLCARSGFARLDELDIP